jgi:hypothetical protein
MKLNGKFRCEASTVYRRVIYIKLHVISEQFFSLFLHCTVLAKRNVMVVKCNGGEM